MGIRLDRNARHSLEARMGDTGFTPSVRDVESLIAWIADTSDPPSEFYIKASHSAVLRADKMHHARAIACVIGHLESAERPARGHLMRLLGALVAPLPDACDTGEGYHASPRSAALQEATSLGRARLIQSLNDRDIKTRHAAARALGNVVLRDAAERQRLEQCFLAAWDEGPHDNRPHLAQAMGKHGLHSARERLEQSVHATDKAGSSQRRQVGRTGEIDASTISRNTARARIILDREHHRHTPQSVDLTRSFGSPVGIRFHVRAGIEQLLCDELGSTWRPRIGAPSVVDARLDGPLSRATAVRTALHVSFPVDPVAVRGDLAETIVRALCTPFALARFRAFTTPSPDPIRFRLAWAHGGHRRALAWRCAELVANATRELINDPTQSTWEVRVDDSDGHVRLELVPRAFADARFAYRVATVPASSHPTLAAALARMVPANADDLVWDPFMGAGAELIERAHAGPYAHLFGTDIDPTAVAAATKNMHSANVQNTSIHQADATSFEPGANTKVSAIVTNPPMGRRVHRGSHRLVLEQFLRHAARVLRPGGTLTWAAPDPRLHEIAEREGLRCERAFAVDMGGFSAEFSVYRALTR